MSVAPTVAELPLQDIRFLFGTVPQIRMLPDKLQQTGKASPGEFKLVAHFPASSGATEADKKAYLNRHAGFQGGDFSIYYDGTYSLDEINWDATNRAGVHLITQDKYGNTVQFPVVPSKSVPGDLKLLVSEYVESILNPPLMVRCSAIGGRLTPDANAANTFDLSVNPQQPKCPVKARPHVPKQYHAEEMTMDHGRYVVDASALTDAEIEYLNFYLYGAEVNTSPDRLPGESTKEMMKRRDTPEYLAARKERQKKKRQDVQQTAPYLKVKGYEDYKTGTAYVLDVGLPSSVLLHKKDLKNSGMEIDEIDTIQVHSQEGGRFPMIVDNRFKGWSGFAAETFNSPYAGSSALSGVGLSTSQLTSTVGSGTFDEASLNSSGHMNVFANAEDEETEYPCDICDKPAKYNFQDTTVRYEIIDDDFENPKVSEYGGQNQNDFYCEACAKKYEGSAFYILRSEEGSTPVQDPMEFGEMANWRPLDGTPGLKRQRAENAEDFIPWSEEADSEDCYICGKDNSAYYVEEEDNICEPCAAKWRYDEGGPEGEGYYRVSAMNAETLRDSGQRNAYATVNFEWTCQGLPEGFDNYSEIEQQVVNQIGYVTDNINMDFNRHYDTMEVEIDGVFYPCEFEYQLEFNEINYHGAENFNAYSDPISERQVWKIGQLGGDRGLALHMNRSQASDYIKDLMGNPSGTWK